MGMTAALMLVCGLLAAQDSGCRTPETGIARPAACQETVLVFVTKAAFQGNLGGLTGADERCEAAARRAGLPGHFRAWLSTADQPAGARVAQKDVPYVMPGGIQVADDYRDLTDGHLAHPIDRTEYGENRAVAVPGADGHHSRRPGAGAYLFGLDVAPPLRRGRLGRHGRHLRCLVPYRGISRPLRLPCASVLPGAVSFLRPPSCTPSWDNRSSVPHWPVPGRMGHLVPPVPR